MVDAHRPTTTPHTPPKPNAHTSPAHPAQGSVNPRENPPVHPTTPATPATPSGAVVITHAPPLPVEQPTASNVQKPVMETGDAEQEAGRTAMDQWKKRQAAEEEAGKAAVARHASLRPLPSPLSSPEEREQQSV